MPDADEVSTEEMFKNGDTRENKEWWLGRVLLLKPWQLENMYKKAWARSEDDVPKLKIIMVAQKSSGDHYVVCGTPS